jgi:hypothetical protein
VFCDRCKIKSDRGLEVKITVIVRVKGKEEKEEEARTAALDNVKRLNRA